MDPFIQRYYRAINRECGDPHTSDRYPNEDRLSDLHDFDQNFFDRLLNVAGQNSLMGYAEATVTLSSGTLFYNFPYGLRQFLQLEYRVNNVATAFLRSKQFFRDYYGVDILTSNRGFRLFPPRNISSDQDWTLCYLRSPGFLHYAKATSVSSDGKSIVSGPPPTDGGEIHLIDDFYNGVELRIYDSGNGAHPQVRVVTDFVVTQRRLSKPEGVFQLREALSPVPLQYDRIYALSAAIAELRRRDKHVKAESLEKEWNKKWVGCVAHFSSNTMDRGPERMSPIKPEDLMPSGVPFA
jgi:hypothetical protein